MSDPEVPDNEQHHDVDHVVGRANEGLDAAAAARADTPGAAEPHPVDPDMAAFEAAERDYPGTFVESEPAVAHGTSGDGSADVDAHRAVAHPADADGADVQAAPADVDGAERADAAAERRVAGNTASGPASDEARVSDDTRASDETRASDDTRVIDAERDHHPTVADTAYAARADADTETRVVPAEPVAPPVAPQPIFVQAPEPPRELGNRGTAGAIGLVASVAFAILYLGAILGFGALGGEVTAENVGTAALAPLTTWSFWVPVAVFFLSFWLLGAFINRARWGKWVIFGLFVAIATYGGYILGQLFQEPFWRVTASESAELVNEQLLAPLAIASFIFARELTIWFGAWVARSGARKKALNAEAQAEYERTLEAGPVALR